VFVSGTNITAVAKKRQSLLQEVQNGEDYVLKEVLFLVQSRMGGHEN
jgi:hypothetical protein